MSSTSNNGALNRTFSPYSSFSETFSGEEFSNLYIIFYFISLSNSFFFYSASLYFYIYSSFVNSVISPFSLLFKISWSIFSYSLFFYSAIYSFSRKLLYSFLSFFRSFTTDKSLAIDNFTFFI
jgi:hypothetical protein